MLCLPEFDTYHILEQYARAPSSARNILALKFLKKRAALTLQWRALCCRLSSADLLEDLIDLQSGHISEKAKSRPKPVNFNEMTEAEMMDYYNKALAAAGMSIDPEALAKAQQE